MASCARHDGSARAASCSAIARSGGTAVAAGEARRLARAPSPRELEAVPSQRSVSPSTVGHHCAAVPSRTRSVRREAGEVVGGGVASLQRAPSCSRGQHHAALKHQNSNSGFKLQLAASLRCRLFLISNFQLLNTCASLTERSRSPSICGDRELS